MATMNPVRLCVFFTMLFPLLSLGCAGALADKPVVLEAHPVDDAYAATVAQALYATESFGTAAVNGGILAYRQQLISEEIAAHILDAADRLHAAILGARDTLAVYVQEGGDKARLERALLVTKLAMEQLLRLTGGGQE